MTKQRVVTQRIAEKESLLPSFLEFEGHEFDVVLRRRMGATRHRLESLFDNDDKIDAHLKSMLWRIRKLMGEGGEERKILRWIGFYIGVQEARGKNLPVELAKFKQEASKFKPKELSRRQMDNYKHQASEYVQLCSEEIEKILRRNPNPELTKEKKILTKIRDVAKKLPEYIDNYSTTEAMSSIGYCQGLLVGSGKFTIMDVRGHNRKKDLDEERFPGDPHHIRRRK